MKLSFSRRDTDMTQGVIWRQLVSFAIPMAIGLVFQQLYNTVDTIVVGQFVSTQALAAVGSTSPIINMLVGLCAGLSTGASVVISQCYGAHDDPALKRAVHTTIALTFLLGLAATAAGTVIVEPMLRLMDMPADVFPDAKRYLSIYFGGILGLFVYNMGAGILRAVGDSRRPLYFLCFSAVMNTVLDLLFVLKLRMGVEGVAYATITAQLMSALLVLWVLSREHTAYGLRWREMRLHGPTLRRIVSIGLPSAVQQGITAFSNVFVMSYINFFGSNCMAGWSTYNKLDVFVLIPMQAIGTASTTFVGQNIGAKRYDRARKGVTHSLMMAGGVTLLLAAVVMALCPWLLRMFTDDPAVLDYGVWFIRLISPFYALCCFNQIYAGALRGIGNARAPMFIMLFSFVAFRQMYLYAARALGNNFTAISLAYPIGWVVCSALLAIVYHHSPLCNGKLEREAAAQSRPQ